MTLAVAICSLMMAGLFSAMLLAGRAADSPYKQAPLDVHALLDRMRSDAASATAIPKLTSTAVTFTVPDRNGDGAPESITYDWSQANAAIRFVLRTYNGTAEQINLVSTTSFAVSSDVDQTTTSDTSESAEQLLFSRTPTLPVAYSIKSSQSMGQFIQPSLPSGALTWRVTRVRFPVRSKGATGGIVRVEVRRASGGLPKTILDEAAVYESSLSTSYATQEVTFANASGLSTATGACIVWHWAKDADACEVQYESLLAVLANGQRVTSIDGGATWSANTLQAAGVDVYGTYTLPAGVTIRRLRAISVSVQADASLAAPTTTTIRFPNLPQVTG